MTFDLPQFAEKYLLACQAAAETTPRGGLCGFELEWNLVDSSLNPLLNVGAGPRQQSFVDYLRARCLSDWLRPHSALEVFNWMIEWPTRPYYHLLGAVYEARLLEGAMINAMRRAGDEFGERLYFWHGNLLHPVEVGHASIPGSWHLAKRRYLERCVDLFGARLATAGIHTNLSLPEPLLAWDFMHHSSAERSRYSADLSLPTHLDTFKSQVYITATRLMRAFTPIFIATSASTPLKGGLEDGKPVVRISEFDSVRNLTFPNPPNLDIPNLYRSYNDYLQLSYDLVRRGVRFGNNNWTPVRARSFAEPVERLIAVTSEQLHGLYERGLYTSRGANGADPVEELARKIEMQNLLARIDLPMARVEIRTDEGGHPLELDLANLALKHLLLVRFYADDEFGRAFRYDAEDIARAQKNEDLAARHGLRAEIAHPFTAKPVALRDFLRWTLDELRPLAEALGEWEMLSPLVEMANGAPNTAESMRASLRKEAGGEVVPLELLRAMIERHEAEVIRDIEKIAASLPRLESEGEKLGEFLQRSLEDVRMDAGAPVRFRARPEDLLEPVYPDKPSEVVDLARQLIHIPSVTACPEERLDEVTRVAVWVFEYLRNHGLEVRYFNNSKYPAVLAGFPGSLTAPVLLSGHFDVVAPEPDDGQFQTRIEGDYLWGRGAADMKTVVATNMVWMKDMLRQGAPYPPVSLLLVGNEENGEGEPMGTPHVLRLLHQESGYAPALVIAGERTGEQGNELWGEICTENRGIMRFELTRRGQRAHPGVKGAQPDLSEGFAEARAAIKEMFTRHLTLSSADGWQSNARFPFTQVGSAGVYNITADYGTLGVEIRPIPQDRLAPLRAAAEAYCAAHDLEFCLTAMEDGIICDPANPWLQRLAAAVQQISGQPARIGRKLPATSARFAPGGQGVVWGQSGIAPHGAGERHFIPSILPYYQALTVFGGKGRSTGDV